MRRQTGSLLIAGLVVLMASCRPEATNPSTGDLERYVAQEIINLQVQYVAQGYLSPDGAVIVRVDELPSLPLESGLESRGLSASWKYTGETLVPIAEEETAQAVKNEEVFVFAFSVRSATSQTATVDVLTTYPRTSTQSSRGANKSLWRLVAEKGTWRVVDRETYYFED